MPIAEVDLRQNLHHRQGYVHDRVNGYEACKHLEPCRFQHGGREEGVEKLSLRCESKHCVTPPARLSLGEKGCGLQWWYCPRRLTAEGDVDNAFDVDEVKEHVVKKFGEERRREHPCPPAAPPYTHNSFDDEEQSDANQKGNQIQRSMDRAVMMIRRKNVPRAITL